MNTPQHGNPVAEYNSSRPEVNRDDLSRLRDQGFAPTSITTRCTLKKQSRPMALVPVDKPSASSQSNEGPSSSDSNNKRKREERDDAEQDSVLNSRPLQQPARMQGPAADISAPRVASIPVQPLSTSSNAAEHDQDPDTVLNGSALDEDDTTSQPAGKVVILPDALDTPKSQSPGIAGGLGGCVEVQARPTRVIQIHNMHQVSTAGVTADADTQNGSLPGTGYGGISPAENHHVVPPFLGELDIPDLDEVDGSLTVTLIANGVEDHICVNDSDTLSTLQTHACTRMALNAESCIMKHASSGKMLVKAGEEALTLKEKGIKNGHKILLEQSDLNDLAEGTLSVTVIIDGVEEVIYVNETDQMFALKKQACRLMNIMPDEARTYYMKDAETGERLMQQGEGRLTLSEKGIRNGQKIVLEKPSSRRLSKDEETPYKHGFSLFGDEDNKDKDIKPRRSSEGAGPGLRNRGRSNNTITNYYGPSNQFGGNNSYWRSNEDSVFQGSNPPGVAGLSNLGNTCFMNSSLQCLAHAVPIMTAFLSGSYMADINRTNPLGMKGELAESFGGLMSKLWQGQLSSVSPRGFKERIGRFAPQFSGYAQHDSQEFIAFLLDGLHEDLNRIKNKPYIEEKDSAGRPDALLAAEAWANYRARNDSTIVDHFQGLYKSRLDCPRCKYTSVKFDPFMYLTLPLPESRIRSIPLTAVFLDGAHPPIKVVVDVASAGSVRDVQAAAWKLLSAQLQAKQQQQQTHTEQLTEPNTMDASGLPVAQNGNAFEALPQPPMLVVKVKRGSWNGHQELDIFTRKCRASEIAPSSGRKYSTVETLMLYVYPQPPAGQAIPPSEVPSRTPTPPPPFLAASAAEPTPDVSMSATATNAASRGSGQGQEAAMKLGNLDSLVQEVSCSSFPGAPFGIPHHPGTIPVVVHHVLPDTSSSNYSSYKKYKFFMAPLILWVPTSLIPTTATHPDLELVGSHIQINGSTAKLITRAVHAALLPYRTMTGIEIDENGGVLPEPVTQDDTRTADGDAAGADAQVHSGKCDKDDVAVDLAPSGSSLPPLITASDTDEPLTTSTSAAVAAEPAAAAAVGSIPTQVEASDPLSTNTECNAMELGSPQPTFNVNAADDALATPVITPGDEPIEEQPAAAPDVIILGPALPTTADADIDMASPGGQGTPFAGAATVSQPFNMWAHQGQDVPVHNAAGQAQAGSVGKGFGMWVADDYGQKALCSINIDPEPTAIHVLCEWSPDGGSRWDMSLLQAQPEEHDSVAAHSEAQRAGKAPVTLQACVEAFIQPEELSEDDSWYCPRCKDHVQADKKLDLWGPLPEVLVVHLKRFQFTKYSRDKLDTQVDYPFLLDLQPYIIGQTQLQDPSTSHNQQQQQTSPQPDVNHRSTTAPVDTTTGLLPNDEVSTATAAINDANLTSEASTTATHAGSTQQQQQQQQGVSRPVCAASGRVLHNHKYELFGVVNHFGSMGGGHYTAYAKMPGSEQWYNFDDSSATAVPAEEVVTRSAYLLFYRARDAVKNDPPNLLQELLAKRVEAQRQEQAQKDTDMQDIDQDAGPSADKQQDGVAMCNTPVSSRSLPGSRGSSPQPPLARPSTPTQGHGSGNLPEEPLHLPAFSPAVPYILVEENDNTAYDANNDPDAYNPDDWVNTSALHSRAVRELDDLDMYNMDAAGVRDGTGQSRPGQSNDHHNARGLNLVRKGSWNIGTNTAAADLDGNYRGDYEELGHSPNVTSRQLSEDLNGFGYLDIPSTPSDRGDLSSFEGDDVDEEQAHVSVGTYEGQGQDFPPHLQGPASTLSYKMMSELPTASTASLSHHQSEALAASQGYGGGTTGTQPMAISPMKHHITTAVGHGTLPVRGGNAPLHDGNAAAGSGPRPASSTGVTEQYGAMSVEHDSTVDGV